ncbi:transglutaminase-like cysteine peptidase [Colwellia sp. 4_MG-2023]|uniref:transglutaminase-like cysteine peptidase n=1 Tax=unclassified Colwellia TaxID=196834 RepID=UPI001C08D98F|nr:MULTISPECIES: transglutaminase-like cysteine peptidase [unclassified Colwellia]MBU2924995.1 transglutaminase-like cysteine peptidase [Colwellia sp. C2M11]MDO6486400.1 transglutaminase-like cysteine peptidase [Colwellia sp. 6_MG-2023]MDO6506278.1 transglutaminase-like cysteine peptidase [Colwellia sp. 5_MG-2023]MDO6557358.1 transglutaminase-like cysteine peptidase [Colwellia sp. 4_MG-2023]MDO6651712.1 transglutaminase-like cysteine peptidase [Colwellia sp. 3_MG-2023]
MKFVQVLLILLLSPAIFARSILPLDEEKIISSLTQSYGERAGKRGKTWFNLMQQKSDISELEKLKEVNNFFNLFRFIDDKILWGVSNYWATPVEFIGVNGGDCEDYSIAKYFTLLELGIADEKMRITMVKAVKLNQYHMVLAYYDTPNAMPLILDNIDGVIKPASQRNDLIPIYSFNASQLWLNKEKGRGVISGKSSKLKLWRELRERITTSKLKQPKLKMEF